MVRKSKKALEMAFNTIIVIIILILLLALILVFFTKNFENFKTKFESFFSSSNVDNIIETCNRQADLNNFYDFCCVNKTIVLSKKEKIEATCFQSLNQTWAGSIQKIDCSNIC